MHVNCLIVDDEITLAQSTAEYFTMFDVSASVVSNAEDCLLFLKQNSVDLLLLDINLDQSSGFDLCKAIRQTNALPILFISARQSDGDISYDCKFIGYYYFHNYDNCYFFDIVSCHQNFVA